MNAKVPFFSHYGSAFHNPVLSMKDQNCVCSKVLSKHDYIHFLDFLHFLTRMKIEVIQCSRETTLTELFKVPSEKGSTFPLGSHSFLLE